MGPRVGTGVNRNYDILQRNLGALRPRHHPRVVRNWSLPLQPESNFFVSHNWVEDNGTACVQAGLLVWGGQHGALSNNYVFNNDPYTGILFTDHGAGWAPSLDWQVQDNFIANNKATGVDVAMRSSGIVLQGNQIVNNGSALASFCRETLEIVLLKLWARDRLVLCCFIYKYEATIAICQGATNIISMVFSRLGAESRRRFPQQDVAPPRRQSRNPLCLSGTLEMAGLRPLLAGGLVSCPSITRRFASGCWSAPPRPPRPGTARALWPDSAAGPGRESAPRCGPQCPPGTVGSS